MPALARFFGITIRMFFQKIVKMWIDEHQEELLNIWNTQKFAKVAPLE